MALKVEGIMDGGMHAEKALGGSSRFEPLQRLMHEHPVRLNVVYKTRTLR
jgi:hypothetical protein